MLLQCAVQYGRSLPLASLVMQQHLLNPIYVPLQLRSAVELAKGDKEAAKATQHHQYVALKTYGGHMPGVGHCMVRFLNCHETFCSTAFHIGTSSTRITFRSDRQTGEHFGARHSGVSNIVRFVQATYPAGQSLTSKDNAAGMRPIWPRPLPYSRLMPITE